MPYADPKKEAECKARLYKEARKTWEFKVKVLFKGAKKRAESKNLALSITEEHIAHLLEVQGYKCAATGVELTLDMLEGVAMHPHGPSVDRIDPKQGYTPENSQVVCVQYNGAKGQWPVKYLHKLAKCILEPIQ